MNKPVLLIMAAGLGSRYGGLKQMDPIDPQGHLIIDYSLFDAMEAGFEEVVFVIKEENLSMFRERIGDRVADKMKVHYAFQKLGDIPAPYSVPEGRVKPWGTGQAVLCASECIGNRPFAVINADDFYGKKAFRLIFDYLSAVSDDNKYHYAMVGYEVGKTVTENGSVARGVCRTDDNGYLAEIVERTHIEKRPYGAAYTEDDGNTWTDLPADTPVSMNMWGFSAGLMRELQERFPVFLERTMRENPMKGEFFLPFVVDELLTEGKADVKVLRTPDQWYGVTYIQDKPFVMDAIQKMKDEGAYPEHFSKL
ncbi:MAG TPA: nucleotidyltransferase [Lachnospiraceae bacterium]|nr:nucleotidyltransferase [Lachnospiraceae bacterium]